MIQSAFFISLFVFSTLALGTINDRSIILELSHLMHGERCIGLPDVGAIDQVVVFSGAKGHSRKVFEVHCGEFLDDSKIYFVKTADGDIKPLTFPTPVYDAKFISTKKIECIEMAGIRSSSNLEGISFDPEAALFQTSYDVDETLVKGVWKLFGDEVILTYFSHDFSVDGIENPVALFDLNKWPKNGNPKICK